MSSHYLIFGLLEPGRPEICFVGASGSGTSGILQWWSHALKRGRGGKEFRDWCQDLDSRGLRFESKTLESVESLDRLECQLAHWLDVTGAKPIQSRTRNRVGQISHGDSVRSEVIRMIIQNPKVSNSEIGMALGISPRQAARYIKDLVDLGLAESKVSCVKLSMSFVVERTLKIL